MANLLLLMLLYILIGFMVASLGLCFQHFQRPKMIFNGYNEWLNKLSRKSKFWMHLTKPLGICEYCNSTWIAIVVFIYFFGLSLTIFLFIGIVWFFVHLINHKLPI